MQEVGAEEVQTLFPFKSMLLKLVDNGTKTKGAEYTLTSDTFQEGLFAGFDIKVNCVNQLACIRCSTVRAEYHNWS